MPIYEYSCGSCGNTTEAMQKVAEAPLTKCPHCGKDTLSKVVSRTSFQLKGTGWYATDYRKPSSSSPSKSDVKSDTSTSTDTTSPQKPDTKKSPSE